MLKYDIQGYKHRHNEVCRQAQAFQGHYESPIVTAGSQTFKTTATQEKEEITKKNKYK